MAGGVCAHAATVMLANALPKTSRRPARGLNGCAGADLRGMLFIVVSSRILIHASRMFLSMKASHKNERVDRELFPIAQGSVPNCVPRAAPPDDAVRRMHSVMSSESLPPLKKDAARRTPRSPVWRDLACVLAATFVAGALFARFDFNEYAYRLMRSAERFQLDELPPTLVVLAVGFAWFAWRRYREARSEVRRRRALEEAEHLLAENRRLASQALAAQETERRHLARELHDELGQYLNAISLDAGRIHDLSAEREAEIHRLSLALMQSATHVYREIGGMIRKLRPIGLDEFGLPTALEHCVDGWRERLPDATFTFTVDGDFDNLSDALNITLYRLVQEGLTNVSKFSRTSRVEIYLARAPEEIVVTMADDGPGVDLAKPRKGLGLIGMRERVEALGGEFHVASEPGAGFLFCARVPAQAGLPLPTDPRAPSEPNEAVNAASADPAKSAK
ncbi:Signal transduction histidine kinase, glucose-6-phosphate specific [Candidatus Paraburkholderia kirkii]|nr:Signal transduction histidine kinase, glucose-6-phosphate specific [Candidatus Paraburkholderia kirkii]